MLNGLIHEASENGNIINIRYQQKQVGCWRIRKKQIKYYDVKYILMKNSENRGGLVFLWSNNTEEKDKDFKEYMDSGFWDALNPPDKTWAGIL